MNDEQMRECREAFEQEFRRRYAASPPVALNCKAQIGQTYGNAIAESGWLFFQAAWNTRTSPTPPANYGDAPPRENGVSNAALAPDCAETPRNSSQPEKRCDISDTAWLLRMIETCDDSGQRKAFVDHLRPYLRSPEPTAEQPAESGNVDIMWKNHYHMVAPALNRAVSLLPKDKQDEFIGVIAKYGIPSTDLGSAYSVDLSKQMHEPRMTLSTDGQPVDWTEDAAHENGNYQCRCLNCNRLFVGHKRRLVCKVCSIPSDCRKAFDQWLDSDATPTLTARSKYYTAQERVLGWLAFQAAWHMRKPEPVSVDLEKCIRAASKADHGTGRINDYPEIAKAVIESLKEQGVEVVYGE